MGALLDLLKSDDFRRHTQMFAGTYRFEFVAPWLRGFAFAVHRVFPETPNELDGFREWLVVRFRGRGELFWDGLIREEFGNGEEATVRLFELLDQFLDEVARRGLPVIFEEHRRYEIERYGYSHSR